MRIYSYISVLFLLGGANVARADNTRPTVVINSPVAVDKEQILLGDIAKITAPGSAAGKSTPEKDRIIQQLREIPIGVAPAPRTNSTFLGAMILEKIESAGIKRESIGYSLPASIVIQRGGRELTRDEVLAALREITTPKSGSGSANAAKEVRVQAVQWDNAYSIPNGKLRLGVQILGEPANGRLPIRVEAFVDEIPQAKFLATATVDYWREVPVLSRTLERGMLVSPSDIQLVRVNVSQDSAEIVHDSTDLVGQRAKSRIPAGSLIRKNLLDLPPTVAKGARVAAHFSADGLHATATVTALQDGHPGDIIQLLNESSKKQLRARVVSSEEVEVIAP